MYKKIFILLLVASSLLIAGLVLQGWATDEQKINISDISKSPITKVLPKLKCLARGTPVEFPNDVQIWNEGTTTLKAGGSITWEFEAPNFKGTHKLTEDLLPGKSIYLSNVLPNGVPADTKCKAEYHPPIKHPYQPK